jgi:hypothetical protein
MHLGVSSRDKESFFETKNAISLGLKIHVTPARSRLCPLQTVSPFLASNRRFDIGRLSFFGPTTNRLEVHWSALAVSLDYVELCTYFGDVSRRWPVVDTGLDTQMAPE